MKREKFIYKSKPIKDRKMTLIIGARFKEGAILVSDRKVTEEGTGREYWENKIIQPLEVPLAFAAAGYSHKFKQFNRKIIETVERRLREIEIDNVAFFKARGLEYVESKKKIRKKQFSNQDIKNLEKEGNKGIESSKEVVLPYLYTDEMFIDDCCKLISHVCTGNDGSIRPDLDVLLIRFVRKTPTLHHINFIGEEEEVDYYAIGSGAEHILNFLRTFWRDDMSIEEILKLLYFCIYYVQDLDFDRGVGIEVEKLPDNCVIIDSGELGEFAGFEGKEKTIIKEIKMEVKKFKDAIDSLPFKKNFS